jgi:gluconate 2-dehydrogenase gamma chain
MPAAERPTMNEPRRPVDPDDTTRRDFIATSGSAMSGLWMMRFAPMIAAAQACATDAMRTGTAFTTFTAREGADFDAFAARIVPTDETPGAREAGAVYFADNALGSFMSELLPIVRGGLEEMNGRVAASFDGVATLAELSEVQQDQIITSVEQEDPGFFFFAKTLVMLGLVTNPEYGGNRDKVGWQLIGFEDDYQYSPPFGYYDRNEHGAGADE